MMETVTVRSSNEQAFNIQVSGLVQGVGFRPRIWQLAQRFDLRGRVSNNGKGVQILVAGEEDNLRHFIHELTHNPPPLAKIAEIFYTSAFPCLTSRKTRLSLPVPTKVLCRPALFRIPSHVRSA